MKKLLQTFLILALIYGGFYVIRAFSTPGGLPQNFKTPFDIKISDLFKTSDSAKGSNNLDSPEASVKNIDLINTGDSGSSSFVKDPSDILVLVNKDHLLDPDFVPEDLVKADVPFAVTASKEEKMMRKEAADALKKLFSDAQKDGIYLCGVSGYRSYKSQEATFEDESEKRGMEYAEHYVAYPGQSEHQTGLAMDVGALNSDTSDFGKSKEGIWIKNNAQKYGFILRYPNGKESITGYNYEPWHIRYVGTRAASEIKTKGMVLEEYLS